MSNNSLTFKLANQAPTAYDAPVIYKGSAPNTLVLTLTNTGQDLQLKGGTSTKERTLPAGQAGIYLDFGSLLAQESGGPKKLLLSASGWAAVFLDNGMWALSPTADMPLHNGEQINITIKGVIGNKNIATGFLTMDCLHLGVIPMFTNQFYVSVVDPPEQGNRDLRLELGVSWAEGFREVYTTAVTNQPFSNNLTLSLRNTLPKPIMAGPNALITFSFIYGTAPGYGALCTAQEGQEVDFTITTPNGNNWQGSQVSVGSAPVWQYKPGERLLGVGEQSQLDFLVSNLVTQLEPGPTQLFVSWSGIPGYDPGSLSLPLRKFRTPAIESFTVSPTTVVLPDPTAVVPVTLNWSVANRPDVVSLDRFGDQPFQGKMTANVNQLNNRFGLSAAFGRGRYRLRKEVAVGVTVAPPSITSFTAAPTTLDFSESLHVPVQLSWAVVNARSVTVAGRAAAPYQLRSGKQTVVVSWNDARPGPGGGTQRIIQLSLAVTGAANQVVQQTINLMVGKIPLLIQDMDRWRDLAQLTQSRNGPVSSPYQIESAQQIFRQVILPQLRIATDKDIAMVTRMLTNIQNQQEGKPIDATWIREVQNYYQSGAKALLNWITATGSSPSASDYPYPNTIGNLTSANLWSSVLNGSFPALAKDFGPDIARELVACNARGLRAAGSIADSLKPRITISSSIKSLLYLDDNKFSAAAMQSLPALCGELLDLVYALAENPDFRPAD